MDWDRIDTDDDATVCTFRLLHSWGGVMQADLWLKAQGFTMGDQFSSSNPYVMQDGTLLINGNWSIKRNGPRFPTHGFFARILSATPYGMNVNVTYDPTGREVLFVGYGYSTL